MREISQKKHLQGKVVNSPSLRNNIGCVSERCASAKQKLFFSQRFLLNLAY